MVAARPKFNPFTKSLMSNNSGFPDFFCWRQEFYLSCQAKNNIYKVIAVESKSNSYLNKEERDKCDWLLKKGVVEQILIAFKNKEGGISYKEYETNRGE